MSNSRAKARAYNRPVAPKAANAVDVSTPVTATSAPKVSFWTKVKAVVKTVTTAIAKPFVFVARKIKGTTLRLAKLFAAAMRKVTSAVKTGIATVVSVVTVTARIAVDSCRMLWNGSRMIAAAAKRCMRNVSRRIKSTVVVVVNRIVSRRTKEPADVFVAAARDGTDCDSTVMTDDIAVYAKAA
jgi:hypothetical protein